jgi:hypothetical protein
VNLHKNLFVLPKHKIPFVFACVLGVKRRLANSYKYAIGYNITSGLKKKKGKNYPSPSHKGIRGKRAIVPLILHLSARWEWLNSHPAALPPYPLNKELGQADIDVFFGKEQILSPDGIRVLDRPARNLVAIHTTLFRLILTGVNTLINICHYFDFLLLRVLSS